ncbi:DUF5675 family protein [Belliella marina]|uniref:DUF5675 family protein n=1 Tax=Belliella marina TaxID=1644146 RepID=A0ABW4VNP9_9BACT
MKLSLHRKYSKRRTLGLIAYQGKMLAKTLELPKNRCIPEGCYEVIFHYSELRGWYLRLVDNEVPIARFQPLTNGKTIPQNAISPVINITSRAKFSRLAFLKLVENLQEVLVQGDRVWLEIVDDPTFLMINDGVSA